MAAQTLSPVYGTRTEFGTDTNLNSLANTNTKTIGAVTNTASPIAAGFKIDATINLATTAVSGTGTLTVYYLESTDGTNYTDGLNITTTSDQSGSIKNAEVFKTYNANSNSQVVRVQFDVVRQIPPKYFSFAIVNNSGASISSTNNSVYYTSFNWTIG